MNGLAIHLLGAPQVTHEGKSVSGFRSVKARALLFFLVASRGPQSRTTLAALLWGDLPEHKANANLRKTLTNLRNIAGPHLLISRDVIEINRENPPWVDSQAFEKALQGNKAPGLKTAIDLYNGDFLKGFYVEGAPDFESWQLAERHRLRELLLSGLMKLAQHEANRGRLTAAIALAQRLLALEPLREKGHRLLMTFLAQHGQRALALAQYRQCAATLANELGVEPADETRALFHQIRDGIFVPPPILTPRHNLPAQLTSLVGRQEERARIAEWLREPGIRLITISGSGGVGKTRLAQEAAWDAIDEFNDGVWIVPLVSLTDIAEVAAAAATRLGATLSGKDSPQTQLLRFLQHKELLLILDNAEHLASQPLVDFIEAILTQSPAVKLIVTSRERLLMQAEQVLDLAGLPHPHEQTDIAAASYPAGKLFLQRAEGHGQTLANTRQTATAIQRLCQLVEGLPLALELTATWTPNMPLQDIVSAVEQGLDVLATSMRDIPVRHRSITAVFDTSWHLLSDDQRRAMRRLAYFRGNFAAQTAADVAGISAAQLQLLVNKSLLRTQAEPDKTQQRYDMHELIRYYASAKLAQRPREAAAVARRHGRHYAGFLAARDEAIQGPDYLVATAQIDEDLDDVRKAWEWAITAGSYEDIARSLETFHAYLFNSQSLFHEAAQRFQQAADEFDGDPGAEVVVGRLLLKAAAHRRMLGQLQQASHLAEQSLAIFFRHESAAEIALATSTLGVIRLQQNNKAAALRQAQQAVEVARNLDAPLALALCLNNLAYVQAHNDNRTAATATAAESLALAQAHRLVHPELSAMNMLGVYYEATGELQRAERILQEMVVRCRTAGVRSRLAQAVNNLGALYKKQGESQKALPLLQEARSLYDTVGQVHYAAFVGVMLGELALEQSAPQTAARYCLQALQTARERALRNLALSALSLYAQLLAARQEAEAAVAVLHYVSEHSATLVDNKEEARNALRALQTNMPQHAYAAAVTSGASWHLDDVIDRATAYCSAI